MLSSDLVHAAAIRKTLAQYSERTFCQGGMVEQGPTTQAHFKSCGSSCRAQHIDGLKVSKRTEMQTRQSPLLLIWLQGYGRGPSDPARQPIPGQPCMTIS